MKLLFFFKIAQFIALLVDPRELTKTKPARRSK